MSATIPAAPAARSSGRRMLLGMGGMLLGATVLSGAATQFVAARLNYHPALGSPVVGRLYQPFAWIEWQSAPWAPNAKATFGIVDSAAMGLAALAMGGALMVSGNRRRKPVKHEGIHGTARFQTEDEIRRSGLLPSATGKGGQGVYVGGWTDAKGQMHYLRHDGPEHVLVVAPTRSGKGVGNILPTLLSWPASSLVYDEKGELWALTAGWRSVRAGNLVVRWEPGAVEGSAGFNFLEEIRLGTPYEVSDAQNVAQMICDPHGEGIEGKDHWGKTSFDLLSALELHILYRAKADGRTACFADVAFAISDPDAASDALWEEMLTNRHLSGGGRHAVVAAAGRDMLDRPEKERGSILSTTKTFLTLFKDPIIAANTRRSSFRLNDLMNHEKPVSLYIVTRGADKERLRPLVRLLLTMAMRHLMGVELEYRDGQAIMPHRHRMLMMLDEFPSLGRLAVIADALPKCAGYGIKAFLAAQNREQVFGTYGPQQSITGNMHIRIVYAPNEYETAKWISDSVGQGTVIKEDVTESGARFGSLRQVSRTFHEVQRPVVTPDEIMALRKPQKDDDGRIIESGEMVIFLAGERPILGTQPLYFIDPVFSQRARMPPPMTGATLANAGGFGAA